MWNVIAISPINRAAEGLRRYGGDCPGPHSFHNAYIKIGEVDWEHRHGGSGYDDFPHDDPRWPTHCSCGYEFSEKDAWQHSMKQLYEGESFRGTLEEAPIGAIWHSDWMGDFWHGPDGKSYTIRLPDKTDWCIDGPSSSGGKWVRAGDYPKITATPSIASSRYHGFLQNGVLTDDLEGRTYD